MEKEYFGLEFRSQAGNHVSAVAAQPHRSAHSQAETARAAAGAGTSTKYQVENQNGKACHNAKKN